MEAVAKVRLPFKPPNAKIVTSFFDHSSAAG